MWAASSWEIFAVWYSTSIHHRSPTKGASSDASGWKIRITTLCASTAAIAAGPRPASTSVLIVGARMGEERMAPCVHLQRRSGQPSSRDVQGADATLELRSRLRTGRARAEQSPGRDADGSEGPVGDRQRLFADSSEARLEPAGRRQSRDEDGAAGLDGPVWGRR